MERLDYSKAVEKDAKEFIESNLDEFVEMMVELEGDPTENDGIMETLNNDFDRSYTPEDAIFVLENSKNEETDSGLWAGADGWRRELEIRAAYTYLNDVREEIKSIYEEAFDEYMTDIQVDNSDDSDGKSGDKESERAKTTLSSYIEDEIEQVQPGSEREKEILSEWIRLNNNVGERGGYPLGSSYIDARCGVGFGMPDQYEYVKTDRKVGKQLPHLDGKYRTDVRKYFEETFGETPTP